MSRSSLRHILKAGPILSQGKARAICRRLPDQNPKANEILVKLLGRIAIPSR
jgi:hypothetical protein